MFRVSGNLQKRREDTRLTPFISAAEHPQLLAVLTTGAYNYSMASNYNRIPRPPVIMIGESGPYVAVRRETYEDLLLCDQ